MSRPRVEHWNRHAAQWQYVGTPLKPTPQDVCQLQGVVADWQASRHGRDLAVGVADTVAADLEVLLLGVTPEIASMQWPGGTRLLAVDRCMDMIEGVWPGAMLPYADVMCSDWCNVALDDQSRDLVVGDGCFTLLAYPAGYHALLRSMRRVLRDDGLFVMRFFVRPKVREETQQVFDDLQAGRIGNFHVFKWRLAMSLHGTSEEGVQLADIWDAWHGARINTSALATRLGWMPESIATIDVYRDVPTRYSFPLLAEVRAVMTGYFSECAHHVGEYELAERCPTLVFTPC